MTREELIELRKQKKRKRALLKTGGMIAVAAGAAIFCAVIFWYVRGKSGTDGSAAQAVDTAETEKMTDVTYGNTGWNIDSSGWWYKTGDGQMYVNGWKTLEGQRYYFKDDGHIATGWLQTNDGTDCYFDASGRYIPDRVPDMIALTYDDGPSSNTDTILDVLEQYNAKATFMVVGEQAEKFNDEVKREYNAGMEIGSHTYDHADLTALSAEEITAELDKNAEVIRSLTGFTPEILRPPGGAVNDTVRETVKVPMILWDVDTRDWATRDTDSTVDKVLSDVQPGSIVLMHDLYESTAEATKTIVPELQSRGYKLVTVSELCAAYGYEMEGGKVYSDFYPENDND